MSFNALIPTLPTIALPSALIVNVSVGAAVVKDIPEPAAIVRVSSVLSELILV